MSEIYLSNKLQQKPDWVYDDITTTGEQIVNLGGADSELEFYDDSDPVQIESILAIQSLAMSSLWRVARAKQASSNGEKNQHSFSILAEDLTTEEFYDGGQEQYMSYLLAEKNSTDWSMRVRFRSNERLPELKQVSEMEDYYFAWTSELQVVAASLSKYTKKADGYTTTDDYTAIRPIANQEAIALRTRMLAHVDKSGAWPEGSFMRPPELDEIYQQGSGRA